MSRMEDRTRNLRIVAFYGKQSHYFINLLDRGISFEMEDAIFCSLGLLAKWLDSHDSCECNC